MKNQFLEFELNEASLVDFCIGVYFNQKCLPLGNITLLYFTNSLVHPSFLFKLVKKDHKLSVEVRGSCIISNTLLIMHV